LQDDNELRTNEAAETEAEKPETAEKDETTLLQEQLETERARAEENYAKYLRAAADMDNQRKRWLKEKEELLRYANLPLLRKLLPIIDDFERAREAAERGGDMASLLKGIELIDKRMHELIEQEGVQSVSALGEIFDPQKHEALSIEDNPDHPDGTIIEEFQTGYLFKDRVLRPSLVKVARAPEN
jgi:molecular chaperone GrpE